MTTDEPLDIGLCFVCGGDPVAGFNDIPFCADHVEEGIGEAARVMAVAHDITDPQRIAAMTEKLITMYREADAAVESGDMKVGDSIDGNTHYSPGNN